jgi:large subunit ribosomal protein L18
MESKRLRAKRRQIGTRSRLAKEGFRLSVSRSNRYLFAQLIDQKTGKTLLGLSNRKSALESKGKTKSARAQEFGEEFAKEVLKKKVKEIVFDRGAYQYHGRIKAFAEGLRKGGLVV